jgi:hypothetical protein
LEKKLNVSMGFLFVLVNFMICEEIVIPKLHVSGCLFESAKQTLGKILTNWLKVSSQKIRKKKSNRNNSRSSNDPLILNDKGEHKTQKRPFKSEMSKP